MISVVRKLTKLLYRFPGLTRVADLVRRSYMGKQLHVTINDFDGDLSFFCDLDEHISSQIFWRGAYSGAQLHVLRTLLKPDDVFLDVGANKGEFTVFAAKYLTRGKVYAFEPVVSLCDELKRNISLNSFSNVEVVNKGLSDHNAIQAVYTSVDKFDGEMNGGIYTLYRRKQVNSEAAKIELITLDEFVWNIGLQKVDIIKVDIEGAELAMLKGAIETIDKWKPIILAELNWYTSIAAGYEPSALLEWLSKAGYRFELISRFGGTKQLQPDAVKKFQNILCIPN